jgi:hypothetical protein
MKSLASLALLAALGAASTGCSPSLKYFRFKVWENNQQVYVNKFFNDGFGAAPHATAAYEAAENGDNDSALKILKGHIDHQGGDAWDYYDLAILYERRHQWDDAEAAIQKAISSDRHDGDRHVDADFPKELGLIRYYRDQENKHAGR